MPKPLDSSIRWVPAGYVDHTQLAEQPFDLFVDHLALRDVMAHLFAAGTNGSFGLFSGRLLTCTSSEMPYIRIRDAHPAEQPLPETEDVGVFREHVRKVADQAEMDNEEVVGWYHAHTLLGVNLTERDSRLHIEHFHQPWQCALVVVPKRTQPEGGFFTRLRGDGAFRRATAPFFEVVPASELGGQPAPSYVGWHNYEADRPYIRLLPDQPGAGQPSDQPGGFELVSTGPAAPERRVTSETAELDPASNPADSVKKPTAEGAETKTVHPVRAADAEVQALEERLNEAIGVAPHAAESDIEESETEGVSESETDSAEKTVVASTAEAPRLSGVYTAEPPATDFAAPSEPEFETTDESEAAVAVAAEVAEPDAEAAHEPEAESANEPDAESASEPDAESASEPLVEEDDAGDAAEASRAKRDAEATLEPAAEEELLPSPLDPLLKKRLEALRPTAPPVQTFRGPREQSSADAVTPEVTGPEPEADEADAHELRWKRWSRRSARSDSAE